MNVLLINGSPHEKGCTYTALTEVGKTLTSAGIDYEIVQLGGDPVRDCIGCNQCSPHCPQGIDIPRELHRISDYVERLRRNKP